MSLVERVAEWPKQWLQEGREQGIAEGRAQGVAEGRAQGVAEGRAQGVAEGRAQGVAEGRAQGVAEGRAQGVAEGRAQGVAQGVDQQRSLLCRLAATRLDADTAARLAELLAPVADPERLAEVGDWLVRCDTAAEFLACVDPAAPA